MATRGSILFLRQILAQRASTDSSNSFLLTVQDEGVEDEAAEKDRAVNQLRVGDDASLGNLLCTEEGITMYHDGAGVCWEVAGRNFHDWAAIEFADEATTEKLIVVARTENGRGDLLLDSVIESWGNPEDAIGHWGLGLI